MPKPSKLQKSIERVLKDPSLQAHFTPKLEALAADAILWAAQWRTYMAANQLATNETIRNIQLGLPHTSPKLMEASHKEWHTLHDQSQAFAATALDLMVELRRYDPRNDDAIDLHDLHDLHDADAT